MEAKATTVPRSTLRRRRFITTAAALCTGATIIRRLATTRRHRVITQRHVITSQRLAITRQDQGRVTGLTRTRAGVIVGTMAGMDAVAIMTVEVAAAVTVDRPIP